METWSRKAGKPLEGGGFVLMEVLPALAILLVAMVVSLRLAWTAMEHNRERMEAHWRERAWPIVWHQWEPASGNVAVAREAENGLQIRFFPDIAWLPGDVAESVPAYLLILRREPVALAGRPAWQLSRRVSLAGGGNRWQPVVMIFQLQRLPEGREAGR